MRVKKSGMYSVVQMIETSQYIHIFSWFKNHVLKKISVEKLFAISVEKLFA